MLCFQDVINFIKHVPHLFVAKLCKHASWLPLKGKIYFTEDSEIAYPSREQIQVNEKISALTIFNVYQRKKRNKWTIATVGFPMITVTYM